MRFIIGLALLAAAPATQAPGPVAAAVDEDQAKIDRAVLLIHDGKPAEAISVLDPLIAAQEKRRAGETQRFYCARGQVESVLYLGTAARDKKPAIVLAKSACYSLFLKGFALIDLNRPDEAEVYFERAVAMAPFNAQFLGELAEWHKNRRDWDQAMSLYKSAEGAAAFSPKEDEIFDRTRALRGQAFILIEQGKMGEAEKLYRKCLELDPNDERSKQELQYIAEQRAKAA
jgi:tetratricopeptide (TPR) repeat protein